RGGGGRHLVHHRPADGGAAAGHRRRGRQVLHPQDGRLHGVPADDRDPDVAAAGPVHPQGGPLMSTPVTTTRDWQAPLMAKARWRPWEFVLWAAAFALPLVFPSHSLMVNEIAIVALFAMSLDLILGYTGIVSLGHAAFFGFGAYAAALFAKHVMPDPTVGLVVAVA